MPHCEGLLHVPQKCYFFARCCELQQSLASWPRREACVAQRLCRTLLLQGEHSRGCGRWCAPPTRSPTGRRSTCWRSCRRCRRRGSPGTRCWRVARLPAAPGCARCNTSLKTPASDAQRSFHSAVLLPCTLRQLCSSQTSALPPHCIQADQAVAMADARTRSCQCSVLFVVRIAGCLGMARLTDQARLNISGARVQQCCRFSISSPSRAGQTALSPPLPLILRRSTEPH